MNFKSITMNNLQSFVLLLFVPVSITKYFIIGPSQVVIKKIGECKEFKNLPFKADVSLSMFNKTTQVLDGKFYIPYDITSDIGIKLKCGKKVKNQLMPNAYNLEDSNLCETLNRYVGDLWWYVEKEIGIEVAKCPIKKGNYSIHNLYLDLSKMKIQMILEGLMFSRLQFLKANKPIFCLDIELQTSKKVT